MVHGGIAASACGDMNVANFGVLASAERNLVFGINDYDETLPGAWEWDLNRLAASVALACIRVPPKNLAQDRFDYGEAIADSWKRQTLSNILRLRYGDAPTFMEVTSVINSYTTVGTVNGGVSLSETTSFGGDTLNLGGSRSWSNSPTVTYQPLTGQKFTTNLLRPIPPSAVFRLISAGWSIPLIFSTTLRSIRGIANQTQGRRGDPEFGRLIEALANIQSSKALNIRVEDRKDGEAVMVVIRRESVPESVLEDMHTVRALLGLKGDATEFSVVYGTVPQNSQEIPVETRSMLELMLEVSAGAEVPPSDMTEGRVLIGRVRPGESPPDPLIRVHNGKSAPADAYVALPYRHMWFWIDDTDRVSKAKFTFLMILFSLAEGGQTSAAPLITVNPGR